MKNWKKTDPNLREEAAKYEKPVPSRECILQTLGEKKGLSREQFNELFKLTSDFEIEAFRRRLCAMMRDSQIYREKSGKYKTAKIAPLLKGRVIGHRDGFGFVSPEDGTADIYLPPRQMSKVFDGDVVSVRISGIDHRNRREGIIIEILERKFDQIVGRFFIDGGVSFVQPDNKKIPQDIIVPEENRNGATSGQLVTVKITSQPSFRKSPIGNVIEIIGDYMAPGLEIEVAMRSYGLPHVWPEQVTEEIKQFNDDIPKSETKKRRDLRMLPLITIDGEDAKDFDDAVYCEPTPKNGFHLIVAIADVSHYVKPGTGLDKEALERGTSVYFPGNVIPMLPRVLSNGLCSLNPSVDRLCMVCDMQINSQGIVSDHTFYPATMRSHARMTYTKVAAILDGDEALQKQHQKILPHIFNLKKLYTALLIQRKKRGALDFDTPEVKVEFGKDRKIKRLYATTRNDAHRIIEECMLCANVCAAQFLEKHKFPALYRVHDVPKSEKVIALKEFLGELGLKLTGSDLPHPKDYARVIDQVKDRPDGFLIQTVLLRSLQQATYSPDNEGHFGLAYEAYAHFTSPIRRYPDLTIHRAIKAILQEQPKKSLPDIENMRTLGQHCSMTERRADEATMSALTWLKCEYMQDKQGETFEGVISGVTGFGLFVQIKDVYIDGLVHIKDIGGDFYQFDPVRHRLIGERTKKIFRLADKVKVQVVRVNLEEKEIDLALI